ncbi:MAG: hypothetical protein D6806_08200 [Deltaproteobacteria bacterium]|nr:MAG: hypothetical protein D6806_08200 [Deltaproteobacteria bacterium]
MKRSIVVFGVSVFVLTGCGSGANRECDFLVDCPVGKICDDGKCVEPVDPCEGVSCDSPDNYDPQCVELPGECRSGQCAYTLKENGTGCDDNNACTENDSCTGGLCKGSLKVCSDPPPNYCNSDQELIVYERIGTCIGGNCEYEWHAQTCDHGCRNGACLGDPCAGVECNDPPEPEVCYVNAGTCSGGSCSYQEADGTACDDGDPCTESDTCQGGLCVGTPKVCNTPPPTECIDATTARIYEKVGTCIDGQCSYGSTEANCPQGCQNGVCKGLTCDTFQCGSPPGQCYEQGRCVEQPDVHCVYDPKTDGSSCDDGDACTKNDSCKAGVCAGTPIVCDTPPVPHCDGDYSVTYDAQGTCVDGSCHYNENRRLCEFGCDGQSGLCNGDPCDGVDCSTAPPPVCNGDTLITYQEPGTCVGGACNFEYTTQFCTFGCANGVCNPDPCEGVVCDAPPADVCENSSQLRHYDPIGQCSGGSCTYPSQLVNCTYGCSNGACNACTPDCFRKCGGADDGCGGTCDSPCGSWYWCNGQACQPCNDSQHCGANCVDCTAGPNNRACVNSACGCLKNADCSTGYICNVSTNSCVPCSPNCESRCGGVDDGCGGQCPIDCPSGEWCDNTVCKPCNEPAHCGPQCQDCTQSNTGHACINGTSCGCNDNNDCPAGKVCDTNNVCVTPGPESDCGDGVDNDLDGLTDCTDGDCQGELCGVDSVCQGLVCTSCCSISCGARAPSCPANCSGCFGNVCCMY